MVDVKKEFPRFRPMAYFGGNLLLFGLSYVLLRQYKRFFILFALMIALGFVPIPYLTMLVLIFSAFDAYSISKKLKTKQIPEPEYNKTSTYAAITIWALLIGARLFVLFFGNRFL